MTQTTEALTDLYEADETAWLDAMVARIADGQYDELDYVHLQEYLADMAERERREVKSRLAVFLMHVLKWVYQKKRRSRSWSTTILLQRGELNDIFTSRSLRKHAEQVLPDAYKRAVRAAATETGLRPDVFPRTCPWNLDELLSDDFPGEDS